MRILLPTVLLLSSALFGQMPIPAGTGFPDIGFLAGYWVSVQAPGEGSGWSQFSWEVQGKVLVRKNHAEYPSSSGRAASVHDDLMIIFGGRDTASALYLDNEGHEIHYDVTSPAKGEALFLGKIEPRSPRYRLSYHALSPDTVTGEFGIAPPGRPDSFSTYLEWKMVRKGNPGAH